ncbi:hypothetical protein GGX14DRAFT_556089 [Mycena pura]|uniref:Uncharacterized protein n=1 Tax=Mycena pura TaxID=153505 RepID=A0AAD7E360_9AGAR|nr:hypothetical protein GGX14DRAFT_556089 [Mycena pura]
MKSSGVDSSRAGRTATSTSPHTPRRCTPSGCRFAQKVRGRCRSLRPLRTQPTPPAHLHAVHLHAAHLHTTPRTAREHATPAHAAREHRLTLPSAHPPCTCTDFACMPPYTSNFVCRRTPAHHLTHQTPPSAPTNASTQPQRLHSPRTCTRRPLHATPPVHDAPAPERHSGICTPRTCTPPRGAVREHATPPLAHLHATTTPHTPDSASARCPRPRLVRPRAAWLFVQDVHFFGDQGRHLTCTPPHLCTTPPHDAPARPELVLDTPYRPAFHATAFHRSACEPIDIPPPPPHRALRACCTGTGVSQTQACQGHGTGVSQTQACQGHGTGVSQTQACQGHGTGVSQTQACQGHGTGVSATWHSRDRHRD